MRIRFGDFVYDCGMRQLLRGDGPAALSPRAVELLGALLERRPNAVAKAELHDRLWPGTFVGPTSLARLVSELRRATGDTPRQSRFVRTVSRYGYAFAGAAREEPVEAPASDLPAGACCLRWGSSEAGLAQGETLIGRAAACAVRILSPGVSRRHARIVLEGKRATLEDLGSKNGTFLGGRAVEGPVALQDGDEITVGREVLLFCGFELEGTTRTDARRR